MVRGLEKGTKRAGMQLLCVLPACRRFLPTTDAHNDGYKEEDDDDDDNDDDDDYYYYYYYYYY